MNPKYADSLTTLKNSKKQQIPLYPKQLIAQAFQQCTLSYNEFKQIAKKINTIQSQTQAEKTQKIFMNGKMVLKIDIIHRLKRFLLLTHQHRIQRIKNQFWQYGGQIRKSQINNMGQVEKKFIIDYQQLVNSYIDNVGLQLTMDKDPPIDTIVQVRVLRDCGEIAEEGIKLQKNSGHFIKKRLVQKFIQRGDIVIIR